MNTQNQIVIFETAHEAVQVRLEGDTLCLSQAQMADVFDVQKAAIFQALEKHFRQW